IPTVSYALNMASTSRNAFSLEASPSVVAVEGKTSRFFEGANVLIVPGGDRTEPLERDIGIDLRVTPNEVGDEAIDLNAVLELSNISASQIVGVGATVVQTEKTSAEANAKIPYGRAIALGSGATMTVRDGEGGVTGLQRVQGAGRLFGSEQASAKRNDVLVLLTARKGIAGSQRVRVDEAALSQRLFGAAPAPVARVARLPSQAARIGVLDWLWGGGADGGRADPAARGRRARARAPARRAGRGTWLRGGRGRHRGRRARGARAPAAARAGHRPGAARRPRRRADGGGARVAPGGGGAGDLGAVRR